MRFYEALDLVPRLSIDADELKRRFYEKSRQWHPDRYSHAGAEEQQTALEISAVLNDAFRTLKDPVSRAEYFLEERGIPPSKQAPPELLEEVFELNMALDELRGGDESVRPRLVEELERFVQMRAQIDEELQGLFAEYDDSGNQPLLTNIRRLLDRRRYVANLVRDVEKELNVHLSN
jgi:molecular chaperone HscB